MEQIYSLYYFVWPSINDTFSPICRQYGLWGPHFFFCILRFFCLFLKCFHMMIILFKNTFSLQFASILFSLLLLLDSYLPDKCRELAACSF